ncbi:hypothetical protein [Sorangium atrum]|uniref:Uncharacterized protein n=1 Tax=Sorangium atrum TaxID=2995308 RepID=A0ABT5BVR5_9BACT|nr:hypothetical protein [Sorangium aterium]MDC0678259.1 hypothetical protein [Sorangium aterium]
MTPGFALRATRDGVLTAIHCTEQKARLEEAIVLRYAGEIGGSSRSGGYVA